MLLPELSGVGLSVTDHGGIDAQTGPSSAVKLHRSKTEGNITAKGTRHKRAVTAASLVAGAEEKSMAILCKMYGFTSTC